MKKKILGLLLMLLVAISCKQEKVISASEFELFFLKNWIYADQMNVLVEPLKVVDRPLGVEQLVTQVRLPSDGGTQTELHCLYYTVPYKDHLGRLVVQRQQKEVSCPEIRRSDDSLISIENISDFSIGVVNQHLKMQFKSSTEKKIIDTALVNLIGAKTFEKYRPMKEEMAISGARILRLSEDSFNKSKSRYLGKLSDRFSNGSAIRCHEVDKNCNTVGEYRCNECQFGWYEVVDYSCPAGGSKFCGQNLCGGKNEPACLRGDLQKLPELEEPASRGICSEEFEPVLNSDNILVCQ